MNLRRYLYFDICISHVQGDCHPLRGDKRVNHYGNSRLLSVY